MVLTGHATFTLGEETLDAPAGTVVFIRDPSVKRHARAEEPDTSVLAVGGPRDAAYEPSPWEQSFAAERYRSVGDYEAMADETRERVSSSTQTIRRCSTTSAALKRSQAGRRTRSSTCAARSSSSPSGQTWPARTRISSPCARCPAGRRASDGCGGSG